jgi:hypothetical protein
MAAGCSFSTFGRDGLAGLGLGSRRAQRHQAGLRPGLGGLDLGGLCPGDRLGGLQVDDVAIDLDPVGGGQQETPDHLGLAGQLELQPSRAGGLVDAPGGDQALALAVHVGADLDVRPGQDHVRRVVLGDQLGLG